jgi:uncharacterized protein DUF6350
MMTAVDDLPPGWLTQFRRGLVEGVGVVLIAVVLVAIPTFLAWFVPGADSTSATSAARAAVLIALSANHGGLILDGTAITLTPLGVTVLLAALVASHARRQPTGTAFTGLATGYTLAASVGAHWATLGATRISATHTTIAAAAFALAVGGLTRGAPAIWHRAGFRWQKVIRAAGVGTCVYLAAGALLVAGALAAHLSEASRVQGALATGVGGLPVALLGLGAAPNAALAGVGYLTGPGFAIGTHTSVSLFGVQHGRLPLFPMLAAVPSGAPTLALGLSVSIATALAAGWLVLRLIGRDGSGRDRAVGVIVAAGLIGGSLGVLGTLASGSLGNGSLHHVGVTGWLLAVGATAVIAVSGLGWLSVDLLLGHTNKRAAEESPTGESQPAAEMPAAATTPAATAPAATAPADKPPVPGEPPTVATDPAVRPLGRTG